MMRVFAGSGDFDQAVAVGLSQLTKALDAEASSLFLVEPLFSAGPSEDLYPDEDGAYPDILCHACHGPVDITGYRLSWGKGIVGRAIAENRVQSVRDATGDPDFGGDGVADDTGFVTRSVLAAPLSIGDEVLGAVEVLNKHPSSACPDGLFTPADEETMLALATAAALAIDNARMVQALADQERFRHELDLAADIQRGLLPPDRPDPFPIHGINRPLSAVSGDFYDVVALPDGRLWAAIADVSGKGMNAALLMVKTASLFRCLAKESPTPAPGALLARISDELCETASHGMFVTMACLLYDPSDGSVVLANAGHEPPLLHDPKAGTLRAIEGGSPPLGVLPGLFDATGGVEQEEFTIGVGCSLILLTDGLTEATDSHGDMLGVSGTASLIGATAGMEGAARPKAILDAVHGGGWSRRDDMTLMIVTHGDSLSAPLIVPGVAASLPAVRLYTRTQAARIGAPDRWGEDLVLAVGEAAQNVIRHAYHGGDENKTFRIEARLVRREEATGSCQGLEVCVCDQAAALDPACLQGRSLDDLRPGGLGLHLMHMLTDECKFVATGQTVGNRLRLVKWLTAEADTQ